MNPYYQDQRTVRYAGREWNEAEMYEMMNELANDGYDVLIRANAGGWVANVCNPTRPARVWARPEAVNHPWPLLCQAVEKLTAHTKTNEEH